MTTPDAKRIADRYIGRDGSEPESSSPATDAETAWKWNAETIHSFLRKYSKIDAGAKEAIVALERIGSAIAMDEKRALGRRAMSRALPSRDRIGAKTGHGT